MKNKKTRENSDQSFENNETKKKINFKQLKYNQSSKDNDYDNLDNDFSKLKEKFALASESLKEETNISEYNEKENKKNANNVDIDSVQALISRLKSNKDKNKGEPKNNFHLEENEESDSKLYKNRQLELLSKLKGLGLNLNNKNQEATNYLFQKFLNENNTNIAKTVRGNHLKVEEEENSGEKDIISNKQNNIRKKDDIINKKKLQNFDINSISESLAKLKNEKRVANNDDINKENFENNNANDRKKKGQSSTVDFSENINLESLKNLINNSNAKMKNDDGANSKKSNAKGTSHENDETDKIKSKNAVKNDDKKESKKNDFNLSLGEIESQIEMLKNLSIKP